MTGANSGIGYCVAKSLAERNATVHMICRNQERGEEAKRRVLSETGNEDVHLHVVDVSNFRQVRVPPCLYSCASLKHEIGSTTHLPMAERVHRIVLSLVKRDGMS